MHFSAFCSLCTVQYVEVLIPPSIMESESPFSRIRSVPNPRARILELSSRREIWETGSKKKTPVAGHKWDWPLSTVYVVLPSLTGRTLLGSQRDFLARLSGENRAPPPCYTHDMALPKLKCCLGRQRVQYYYSFRIRCKNPLTSPPWFRTFARPSGPSPRPPTSASRTRRGTPVETRGETRGTTSLAIPGRSNKGKKTLFDGFCFGKKSQS